MKEDEGRGLCKISADDIEAEVMSYKSSMNWNVTITVGRRLSFFTGINVYFHAHIQNFQHGHKRETHVVTS